MFNLMQVNYSRGLIFYVKYTIFLSIVFTFVNQNINIKKTKISLKKKVF